MHLSPSFGLIYRLGGGISLPISGARGGAGTSWLLSVLVRPARAKITIVLASSTNSRRNEREPVVAIARWNG